MLGVRQKVFYKMSGELKSKIKQLFKENEILVEKLKRQKLKIKSLKRENKELLKNRNSSNLGLIEDCSSDSDFKVTETLPMQFGQIRLESLGQVSLKPNFHTERYIYPIGFTTVRSYHSMINPNIQVEYASMIIDGGDIPLYRVIPQDNPQNPITEKSATACWTTVIRQANKIRNKEHSNSASGPDYFAYSNPKIMKMIQELPLADQCLGYKKVAIINS